MLKKLGYYLGRFSDWRMCFRERYKCVSYNCRTNFWVHDVSTIKECRLFVNHCSYHIVQKLFVCQYWIPARVNRGPIMKLLWPDILQHYISSNLNFATRLKGTWGSDVQLIKQFNSVDLRMQVYLLTFLEAVVQTGWKYLLNLFISGYYDSNVIQLTHKSSKSSEQIKQTRTAPTMNC